MYKIRNFGVTLIFYTSLLCCPRHSIIGVDRRACFRHNSQTWYCERKPHGFTRNFGFAQTSLLSCAKHGWRKFIQFPLINIFGAWKVHVLTRKIPTPFELALILPKSFYNIDRNFQIYKKQDRPLTNLTDINIVPSNSQRQFMGFRGLTVKID